MPRALGSFTCFRHGSLANAGPINSIRTPPRNSFGMFTLGEQESVIVNLDGSSTLLGEEDLKDVGGQIKPRSRTIPQLDA